MRITRVLNTNAVMVIDHTDRTSVVLGRGIGYGKRPGDEVDSSRVTETFLTDSVTPIDRLAAFLTDVPLGIVRVAREIAEAAHEALGIGISQALVLPIADHLAFAVRREREGITLEHPLVWEVSQLYPREVDLGRDAVRLARSHLGVDLPDEEAIPLAMHLVNAQFGATAGMATTVEMTQKIARVVSVVEQCTGVPLDRESMNVARFVTHLRYLFVRLRQGRQFVDNPPELVDAVASAHPDAHRCAQRVRLLLHTNDEYLTDDEVLYLTLHIARLTRVQRLR